MQTVFMGILDSYVKFKEMVVFFFFKSIMPGERSSSLTYR